MREKILGVVVVRAVLLVELVRHCGHGKKADERRTARERDTATCEREQGPKGWQCLLIQQGSRGRAWKEGRMLEIYFILATGLRRVSVRYMINGRNL